MLGVVGALAKVASDRVGLMVSIVGLGAVYVVLMASALYLQHLRLLPQVCIPYGATEYHSFDLCPCTTPSSRTL